MHNVVPVPLRPIRPSLTPSLASALQFAMRSLFPADGPPRQVFDPGWQPPAPAVLREAQQAIAMHEAFLAPIDIDRLGLRLAALQTHYFVPEIDAVVQQVWALDWFQALQHFPEWAVREACSDCVAHQRRRPVPADIVDRCSPLVADHAATLSALRRLVEPPPIQEPPAPRGPHVESKRETIAAAYRKRFDEGRSFRAGLSEDHPDVVAAVAELLDERARQDRELDEARQRLSADEYHAYRMAIIRANLAGFGTRNRRAFGNTAAALDRLRDELGARAQERPSDDSG